MIVDIIRENFVLLGLIWIAAKSVHLFVLHNQRGKTVFTDIDAYPCPVPFFKVTKWLGVVFEENICIMLASTPDICHNHFNRWLCKANLA